ncbi:hypothetical protein MPSEU_000749500 [Mayamaea pseudoterrestris]|nr:hypothetical protein MPSEU_000749500 [Mayamaea pseudoterrestris]
MYNDDSEPCNESNSKRRAAMVDDVSVFSLPSVECKLPKGVDEYDALTEPTRNQDFDSPFKHCTPCVHQTTFGNTLKTIVATSPDDLATRIQSATDVTRSLNKAKQGQNITIDVENGDTSIRRVEAQPGARRIYPSHRCQELVDVSDTSDDNFTYSIVDSHLRMQTLEGNHSEQAIHEPIFQGVAVTSDTNVDGSSGVPVVIQYAEPVSAKQVNGVYVNRGRFIGGVCALILVLCLTGISIGLTRKSRGKEELRNETVDPADSFSQAPTIVRLARMLPSYTTDALQNELPKTSRQSSDWYASGIWSDDNFSPASYQGKAWKWLVSDATSPQRSVEELTLRFSLATLYYTTDGPNWKNNTNWLTSKDVCLWFYGDDPPYEDAKFNSAVEDCLAKGFDQLNLQGNNLVGYLPSEFGLATSLLNVKFPSNSLRGEIPDTIFRNMTQLISLLLSGNEFSGTIPTSIGFMTDLYMLVVNSNNFSGTLPSEMGEMSSLWDLYASNNLFTGRIPTEVGKLLNLNYMLIANNLLSGTIPSELFKLTNLKRLDLTLNRLSGSIASDIGSCRLLTALQVGYNDFDGSIPSEISLLTDLNVLFMNNNTAMVGTIPSRLARLTGLNALAVSGTSMSGSIPSELSHLSRLGSLQVYDTSMTGSVPESVCRAFSQLGANSGIVIDCDELICDCNCTCS